MKQLTSIVKINLKSITTTLLGKENRKKRLLIGIFFFIISTVFSEISLINIFNIFHLNNNEILLFNSIINIEILVCIFIIFIRIMNLFYLNSDWTQMSIYPIKLGKLLLSKCVICYFQGVLVSIFTLIPLLTYGFLTNAGISDYLYMILYQIVMPAIVTLYLTLISLTILLFISLIKKTRSKHKNNKWLIFIDLVVVALTYILLKSPLSSGINITSLTFNIFFTGELLKNYVIIFSIITVSIFGIYIIGSNVYLSIMKSELFNWKSSKKTYTGLNEYDFKLRGTIISNIIRDIKLIIRVPVLRSNCILSTAVFSIICVIMLILFREYVIIFSNQLDGNKSLFVIICFLFLSIFNCTSTISFSREGISLSQFKVYPLSAKEFLFSKICVGVLTNGFAFIGTNVLIILMSSSFIEFALLEMVLIFYLIGITIILIAKDLSSIHIKWVNINDLLFGHGFKVLIPLYILTFLSVVPTLTSRFLSIELTEYMSVSFNIFIITIYSLYGFKNINKLMLK